MMMHGVETDLRDQPQSASQPLPARATLAFGEWQPSSVGPSNSQSFFSVKFPHLRHVTAIIWKSPSTFILVLFAFIFAIFLSGSSNSYTCIVGWVGWRLKHVRAKGFTIYIKYHSISYHRFSMFGMGAIILCYLRPQWRDMTKPPN